MQMASSEHFVNFSLHVSLLWKRKFYLASSNLADTSKTEQYRRNSGSSNPSSLQPVMPLRHVASSESVSFMSFSGWTLKEIYSFLTQRSEHTTRRSYKQFQFRFRWFDLQTDFPPSRLNEKDRTVSLKLLLDASRIWPSAARSEELWRSNGNGNIPHVYMSHVPWAFAKNSYPRHQNNEEVSMFPETLLHEHVSPMFPSFGINENPSMRVVAKILRDDEQATTNLRIFVSNSNKGQILRILLKWNGTIR